MRIRRDKDGQRFLTLHGPDQSALDSVDALLATAEGRCDRKATAEAAKTAAEALATFQEELSQDANAAGTPAEPAAVVAKPAKPKK